MNQIRIATLFSLIVFIAIISFSFTTVEESSYTSYGGSATVEVQYEDGRTRVITETWPCTKSSPNEVKSQLLSSLRGSYYKFVSEVRYQIDPCDNNDRKSYGGTASVRVIYDDQSVEVINESWPCTKSTVAETKGALLNSLQSNYYEFISPVSFSIDSCN